MQQLMEKFQQELSSIKRVASRSDRSDSARGTMWFRMCAHAFELLDAVGVDNETALKLISIRQLVAEHNSMTDVVRHVQRKKPKAAKADNEQVAYQTKTTGERLRSTLADAEETDRESSCGGSWPMEAQADDDAGSSSSDLDECCF